MKNQLRNLALLFSVTALFIFASCEQPTSTPVDWGSAPPPEYIGTWENKVSLFFTNKTSLIIEESGKVSYISKADMTEFISILAESGISEKELWAAIKDPNSTYYEDPGTGLSNSAKITYSSSSPYIMTVRDTGKFEDLKDRLSVSTDGKKLTMTTKYEEGFDRETILTKK